MFESWRASGLEVAVLGLGRSGAAVGRLLRREGIPVYASDQAGADPGDKAGRAVAAVAEELRAAGAAVQVGGHDLPRITRAVAVVVSPGIPPEAPPVAAAHAAGVPVHAELDVGFVALGRPRAVGITGTNGKTTTTALAAHLLRAAGFRSIAAGNIGKALSEVALEGESWDWLAVELSSFQLHDSRWFVPAIGVLTNLSPDHLDRYPAIADYYADKARLFRAADSGSVWVTNADDASVQAMVRGVAGGHRRFSIRAPADGWFDRTAGWLMLGDHRLLPRQDLTLLGDHNVANALAASLAVAAAGAPPESIATGLRSFRALPHRLEPVGENGGVLWINDSKATNIASTEVALDAMERPYVLLLGGRHKGEPYTRLADHMGGRCRAVVAFGEAGDLVARDLDGRVPVVRGTTFDDVLNRALGLARPGDAILLSPACSSYDMFRNYEERGARFRAAVEAL